MCHKSMLKLGTRVKFLKDYRDRENSCLNLRKGDEIEVVEWENDENESQPEGWFRGKLIKYGIPSNNKVKFHVSHVSDPLHEKVSVWSRIKSVALD